ncbi:MAG TPA: NAD(P)/FAD-dependent oxidoreductase [Spirochaetota bacterium]|nr:NAD(P)/FAD-dependent oxidoreductase [Spirochaetota bacterium]HQF06563.1 NAD(P)/FAD-dependent oxidoreductase [Spirochaetota bacterium]HQH96034.1 NAD(P)/FAD-dependent oxidoreductase [Spirochaetota bacterium]HQJ70352.1 NAD(P)/FAD-dependent oxidoreductase [Spirochaetota bacterium]HRS78650.1 NAD(P)/FAD-dependent oxidoreductase [Spirochaetota bacterium]
MKEYDIVIIGSGPAGYTAAFEAVKHNMKTAIIERDPARLGGVCLGEGCIPLKGLLKLSETVKDYAAIRDTVMKRVERIRAGLASRIRTQGIEVMEGSAKFASAGEIRVDGAPVKAKHFIIATGSSPKRLFDQPNVHTSEVIFTMEKAPGSVLIIGGGVVGCEYASFLNNIGVKVDIVEVMDSLLFGEDEESVRALAREFRKKGIQVFAKTKVSAIGRDGEVVMTGEKEMRQKYDLVIEATGRRPGTAGLGLDSAGVSLTDRGFIRVNESMQTSAPTIYAAGDCIDSPMLAYTAYKEAETAVRHCATGARGGIDYGTMPRLVFSMPQVGSVGLNEKAAAERKINYRVYRYFFKALGKAVMEGKDTGFVKLVSDEDRGTIAGAVAVGDDIADILNQLALIVSGGVPMSAIRDCMFVHPSYSEIILEALQYGKM